MRLYHIKRQSSTKAEYDRIEAGIISQAKELGIPPREHQAQLWEKVRGNRSSYGDYMRQMRLL